MQKPIILILVCALAVCLGCRSTNCTAIYEQSPWEYEKGAREHFDSYKHILAVGVYENHAEDRGPHKLGVLHFNGTVVKSYKGDWKFSERISFVHYVDYRPSMTISNQDVGEIFFVFTNEHTNQPIGLYTGDFIGYDTNMERVLNCVFPKAGRK